MLRQRFRTALFLAASLAAPAAAQSASDPGFGVGLLGVATRGNDTGSAALSAGVHVRARLTGGLGLEGLVLWRRETFSVGGEELLRLQEIPVQGSVMLFFLYRTPVQPYLLGGAGFYLVRAKGKGSNADYGSDTESKFAFHAGAGVDVRVATRASVHADLRRVFLDVDAVNALDARTGAGIGAAYWQVGAGLTLYF